MRQIKFRAWDNYESNWADVGDGSLLGIMQIDDLYNKFVRFNKSFEWMQFTGLHDKNGREIYEGDIVSWGGSMYGFGQVVYEEYSFVVKYKLGKVLDTMYFNHPDAYTVIGNIHETLRHHGRRIRRNK